VAILKSLLHICEIKIVDKRFQKELDEIEKEIRLANRRIVFAYKLIKAIKKKYEDK